MRNFHKKTLAVVAGGVLLSSNALAYQSNTGAGATNQYGGSANQYRIQQNYQRPPVQNYYQPAPVPQPSHFKFIPHPSGLPGYPPVLVDMSPEAAKRIGDFAAKQVAPCIKGSVVGAGAGFYKGGPKGAVSGAATGCVGNVITH
jgi:hypothetical protein